MTIGDWMEPDILGSWIWYEAVQTQICLKIAWHREYNVIFVQVLLWSFLIVSHVFHRKANWILDRIFSL